LSGGKIGGWGIAQNYLANVNSNGGVKLDASNKVLTFRTGSNSDTEIVKIGNLGSNKYGIKALDSDDSSKTIFKLGEDGNEIAGWKITDAAITGGKMVIRKEGLIESSNFASNVAGSGFRLSAEAGGFLEVENARIRGTLSTAVFEKEAVNAVGGVDNIILAFEFADNDVYRAVTHNKGIMNGTIAVANAVGQDSRAIEAAANAYAAKSGQYRSLSKWSKDSDGNLIGELEIPLSVGIVGGIANVHPVAKVCTKILGAESAQELACVMAATGLAQNYSAIRALSTEGIQKGHMRLHARNLASAAGATSEQIDEIVQKMIEQKSISLEKAKELLDQI
jgi:hypothetical protein